MPDIASLLKAEIIRLSKKTVRQHVAPLQRTSTAQRHEIAALKKSIVALERQVSALRRASVKSRAVADDSETQPKHRFVAKGLRTLRSRLGLSQEEFGQLVGVSAQSVYNWEHETSRPRPAQMAAIASARSMGKRAASKKLEELRSHKRKSKK